MQDLLDRLARQRQVNPQLHLYALVDGLQYEQHTGSRLIRQPGVNLALFDGTPDAALAHAGPWLIDVLEGEPGEAKVLAELDQVRPAVIWLFASRPMLRLGIELTRRLDIVLPDGQAGLLRYYDPRILAGMAQTLDGPQRQDFFGVVEEWHFFYQGRRAHIGKA